MANPLAIELHASAEEPADGPGSAVDVSLDDDLVSTYERGGAKLTLDVTAVTGTGSPTLSVVIETSPTSGVSGSWEQVGRFEPATKVGYEKLAVAGLQRYVRCRWSLTGTGPRFTFALDGVAVAIYAAPLDLEALSTPSKVLERATDNNKAKALIAATDKAASFIGNSHEMPLVSWGDDVRLSTSDIAGYHVINSIVGHRPGPIDESIKDRHDEALEWFKLVAAGQVTPEGLTDATPDTYEGGGVVYSDAKRGW